jgi:two-component system sensor histidine kinase AlgZ
LWVRLPLAAQWSAMPGLGAVCTALVGWPLLALDLIAPAGPTLLAAPLSGAALAALIFHWLRQRARLQLPATTLARLDELQSRIRPHFLFNTLNSAVALVRLDPPRAEEVLEDLAELFRAALVGSGEQVTLGEEVALARRYLAIEQVRFGERLKVSWHIDDAALAARVPSLMLQPLVENAVKHGVEVSSEGGEIQIHAQAHKGQALISITNSVPQTAAGTPGSKGQGMALRNVRERLQLLHDLTMRFEAGSIDGGRYRVRIALPLLAAEG